MFYYGMTMRPFSPGAQPDGWKEVRSGNKAVMNIIGYDHRLSPEIIGQYGLTEVSETEAVKTKRLLSLPSNCIAVMSGI